MAVWLAVTRQHPVMYERFPARNPHRMHKVFTKLRSRFLIRQIPVNGYRKLTITEYRPYSLIRGRPIALKSKSMLRIRIA
jgi:hypothetical protein